MPESVSTRSAYKMLTCIYLCRTLLFFAPYADFLRKLYQYDTRKEAPKTFIPDASRPLIYNLNTSIASHINLSQQTRYNYPETVYSEFLYIRDRWFDGRILRISPFKISESQDSRVSNPLGFTLFPNLNLSTSQIITRSVGTLFSDRKSG